MTRKLYAFILLAAAVQIGGAQQRTIAEVTEKMQRRYDMTDNIVAQFTQQVKFGFSTLQQKFSGTLTMKKPKMYKVESEHQTLVTDGSTVWAYSPVNKQVVIDRYKENQNSISPDHFLLNLPQNYYSTLLGTETDSSGKLVLLKLVPKDDRSFVKSVKLWVVEGAWEVRRITIIDVNDTETTYNIDRLTLNTTIADAVFSFTPPAGTEIVDLR